MLIQNITYNQKDILMSAEVGFSWYLDSTKLQNHEKWNEAGNKVIRNHYDLRFGQCLSVDIHQLYGMVPQNKNDEITTLSIGFKYPEPIKSTIYAVKQKRLMHL